MIKFFRRIRQTLLSESKLSKYLIYAVGEILLVVIGILIALSINNWNQKRILNNQIKSVYERIILDIDNDIQELSTNLNHWKEKEPIFKMVMNDSINPDLLNLGLSRLITSNPHTNLNKTGVQQLKSYNVKDTLSLRIIEIYDSMEHIHIIPWEQRHTEESIAFVAMLRDNYTWFTEWMSKTIMKENSSPELQHFFLTNLQFKNRVANSNQIIFNNYVPNLEYYIPLLEEIKNQLLLEIK